MKKFLPALILTSLLIMPAIAFSAVPDPQSGGAPEIVTTGDELLDLVEGIGDWVFAALLVVAAIFLTVAGFMFVTAGGNPENVTKARQMLINALIGVAVALGAKGLVLVVTSIMGG